MTLLDFIVILVVLLAGRFVPAVAANLAIIVFAALIAERVIKGERL